MKKKMPKRGVGEDFSGRGSGQKPYAWLHRVPTREEARARRDHRKLPALPRMAAPQEHHQRKLQGGRPASKHVDVEKRLRRALRQGRERVELRPGDVRTLVELYDRIAWRSSPSVMFARAATRGVIDRVEALAGEMKKSGREAEIARELREIVAQARETLRTVVEEEDGVKGEV